MRLVFEGGAARVAHTYKRARGRGRDYTREEVLAALRPLSSGHARAPFCRARRALGVDRPDLPLGQGACARVLCHPPTTPGGLVEGRVQGEVA